MTARAAAIRFICTFVSLGAALLLSGCGSYGDFTLPVLAGARPVRLTVTLRAKPVLERAAGWESSDVLNPSVIAARGQLWNFYSGFDGHTWRTGLATSADGTFWIKRGVVLSPGPKTWERDYIAANGSALAVNDEFWYWYQAGDRDAPQIGFAHSKDGVNWTKEPGPVLRYGPRGTWDERALGDPYVVRLGEWFYMYHLGQNRARQQRLGLARSKDGIHWEKLRSNPVMDLPWPGSGTFQDNGAGEPAVFEYAGRYWMLWTGRDAQERRALGLASSFDGVHWTSEGAPIKGNAAWDSAVVADPTVLIHNGAVRLWFGGGDKPSPDERLNGAIGEGRLEIAQ